MQVAGLRTPELLDELEGHLREEIERHPDFGMDASRAFDNAAKELGAVRELKLEFEKCPLNINNSIKAMKQKLINFAAIFAVLAIGAGFIMPAIAKWKHVGTLAGMDIVLLLLGTAICTFGAGCGVRCFFKRS